jgi:dTDP-L-rhamnose 4-epimerase
MESRQADGVALNIGSGASLSIREVALRLSAVLGQRRIAPEITGQYRAGDIRHCFADVSRARALLGYEPLVDFAAGIEELADWLDRQAAEDQVETARAELQARGLAL